MNLINLIIILEHNYQLVLYNYKALLMLLQHSHLIQTI